MSVSLPPQLPPLPLIGFGTPPLILHCLPVCMSVYLAVGPPHKMRPQNQTSFSLIKGRSVRAHDHSNHISKALSYGNRPSLWGGVWGSVKSPEKKYIVWAVGFQKTAADVFSLWLLTANNFFVQCSLFTSRVLTLLWLYEPSPHLCVRLLDRTVCSCHLGLKQLHIYCWRLTTGLPCEGKFHQNETFWLCKEAGQLRCWRGNQ